MNRITEILWSICKFLFATSFRFMLMAILGPYLIVMCILASLGKEYGIGALFLFIALGLYWLCLSPKKFKTQPVGMRRRSE
jgi:hypothetical protein